MIPCPKCGKKLKTFKRVDHYKEIRAFVVECPSCGFLKYLKRSVSIYTAWKCGFHTGYWEGIKNSTWWTYAYTIIAFILGVLITMAVYGFVGWYWWGRTQ